MTSWLRRAVTGWWFAPVLATVAAAVLALGPALGPGLVQAYDLGWSPDPRFTPFVTGSGSSVARAVPSDAFGVALGWLVGPGVAQKLVLLAILVLGGLGAVALLREVVPAAVGRGAASVAAVAGVWNPFVAERLVIGQWTILLGYALVGWGLRAALRAGRRTPATAPSDLEHEQDAPRTGWLACAGWAAASGVGGANTVLMTVGSMLLVLAARAPWRVVGSTVLVAVGVSACWALPALADPPQSDPAGTAAFSAASDTPLGLFGSVASGGGIWNAAAMPPERARAALALAALVLALASLVAVVVVARRARALALLVPAVVGLGLVLASGADLTGPWWNGLVAHLPGGGVLRDSQKLLAPWVVVLAAGAGGLVSLLPRRAAEGLRAVAVVGLAVLPLALLPSMVWGSHGRLDAVAVPTDYRRAAAELSSAPRGEVGLLPWRQYRRYAWNGSRVSLTLLPRVVDQRVVFDDSLPLSTGTIAGEDPRAAAVSAQIAEGTGAAQALAKAGVSYLAVEKRAGLPVEAIPAELVGRVVHDGPDLLVVTVRGSSPAPSQGSWAWRVGWLLSLATWLGIALVGCVRRVRVPQLLTSLLPFRP